MNACKGDIYLNWDLGSVPEEGTVTGELTYEL